MVAGLAFAAYLFLVAAPRMGTVGADAIAYWRFDPSQPYAFDLGITGAFGYPPPIVRLFEPLHALSWMAFLWLWLGALVATLIWLGWRRALLLLAFPPIAVELYFGNVNLLLAAAIVLGFRYPIAWSFVVLAKVTPGVGLLWFAVRREWRSLAIAVGATFALVAVSAVLDPGLWRAWFDYLGRNSGMTAAGIVPVPLLIRLPLAAALVVWGARTDRRWTVVVAATLALPSVWIGGLAVLAGLAAVNRPELREGGMRADPVPVPAIAAAEVSP